MGEEDEGDAGDSGAERLGADPPPASAVPAFPPIPGLWSAGVGALWTFLLSPLGVCARRVWPGHRALIRGRGSTARRSPAGPRVA